MVRSGRWRQAPGTRTRAGRIALLAGAPAALAGLLAQALAVLALLLLGGGVAMALDPNAATQGELEELRGIGPVISARIIAERNANGAFRDMDDLRERVRGIGVTTQKKLAAAGLQVRGATKGGARAGAGASAASGEPGAVVRQAWMGRSGVVYFDPGPEQAATPATATGRSSAAAGAGRAAPARAPVNAAPAAARGAR